MEEIGRVTERLRVGREQFGIATLAERKEGRTGGEMAATFTELEN